MSGISEQDRALRPRTEELSHTRTSARHALALERTARQCVTYRTETEVDQNSWSNSSQQLAGA